MCCCCTTVTMHAGILLYGGYVSLPSHLGSSSKPSIKAFGLIQVRLHESQKYLEFLPRMYPLCCLSGLRTQSTIWNFPVNGSTWNRGFLSAVDPPPLTAYALIFINSSDALAKLRRDHFLPTNYYQWSLSSSVSTSLLVWPLSHTVLPHATLSYVQGRPLIRLWARQRHPSPRARLFLQPAMIPTFQYILQTFLVLHNLSEVTSVP